MAGKIDKDGTVYGPACLELVGSTEIWMGSFHVADIRPEVGRGTRLSHVEALLENANEDMVHEAAHAEDMAELRKELEEEVKDAEKQSDDLQRQLEEADARTECAESIIKELDKKGPKATILSLMDQVATLTQEAVHSAAWLAKANAEIKRLKAKKK
jgi:predicted  nucleic acid-binding Zn-ribbon protein